MKLGVVLTARCNARCGHCSSGCGPHRSESLSADEVQALMDEAATLADTGNLEFFLSGGEPTLDLDLLHSLIRHARKLGARITCVTNAHWATNDARARKVLGGLKEAGLTAISFSSSRFHQDFIPVDSVRRAIIAAREIGLSPVLKYARLKGEPGDVAQWALDAGASAAHVFPVMPYLNQGTTLPDSVFEREPGIPRGPCPAAVISVDESGEACTCGTPGASTSLLSLGNIRDISLRDLRNRFYLGGVQQLLRTRGPAHFAEAISANGAGSFLRGEYAGVCELCTHIANDPRLSAIAARVADAFEADQILSIAKRALARRSPCARSSCIPGENRE